MRDTLKILDRGINRFQGEGVQLRNRGSGCVKEVKSEHLWVRNVRDETRARVRPGHVWEAIERSTLQRSQVMAEIDFTSCVAS